MLKILLLASCSLLPKPLPDTTHPQILTGDFNGDGRRDTIRQDLYSQYLGKLVDLIPSDPEQPERRRPWLDSLQVSVRIMCSVPDSDTLFRHGAAGLLCLINLGDQNRDGGDDIALVVDLADESRLNSCRVFSLCSGRWTQMLSFQIWEGALLENGSADGIPGFLERCNGRWYFRDYLSEEGEQEMRLPVCGAPGRQ